LSYSLFFPTLVILTESVGNCKSLGRIF
jgi:hypothetical protein